ncbi:hypothetical protein ACHAQF_007202 [Verticillium nonalfalfae]
MPNIGDTDQRSSRWIRSLRQGFEVFEGEDGSKLAAINALLDSCNDASDNVQRNANYLVPLRVLPNPELTVTKAFTVVATHNNSQVQFVSECVGNIADAGIEEPVYFFSERIDRNIEILKLETGTADAEICRVPSLFYYIDHAPFARGNSSAPSQGNNITTRAFSPGGGPSSMAVSILEAATPPSHKSLACRQTSLGPRVVALHPGTINDVVVADSMVLAPIPWGSDINGKDTLADAVSAVYVF